MRPSRIEFNGYKYRLSGNYYRRNVWGSKGPSNLHRAIWEFHNGPIPDGFEIHHKDGDTFNNAVENLEQIAMREHQREHLLERIAKGEMQPPSEYALKRAALWHASPDGIEWHKQHGKSSWVGREWHPAICQNCGKSYRTPYPSRSKFCHANCKQEALRKRRGQNVGVRPERRKERVLSGKRDDGQQ
jgi:hypothetical protein